MWEGCKDTQETNRRNGKDEKEALLLACWPPACTSKARSKGPDYSAIGAWWRQIARRAQRRSAVDAGQAFPLTLG